MVKQGHHTPQSQFSIWSSTGYSAIQVIMELVILLQPNNMSHCLHSMQNINGGKLGWDEKLLGCGPSPWTMWPEALKAQVSRYFASCKGPCWYMHCARSFVWRRTSYWRILCSNLSCSSWSNWKLDSGVQCHCESGMHHWPMSRYSPCFIINILISGYSLFSGLC